MRRPKRIYFTNHALERLPQRGITYDDVMRTLRAPDYELPGTKPRTVESYGRVAGGRAFYVVTGARGTVVITVVEVREHS
jgi:hypothetical protein